MPTAYNHVEVGCGKGEFGTRFYSPCLMTDIEWSPNISVVSDANRLALRSDVFTAVIVCNPYGYGFKRDAGTRLMEELLRVLRPGGTIVVIGKSTNPWCQVERIQGIAQSLSTPLAEVTVEVEEIIATERFPGHVFCRVDGSLTVPDVEIRVGMRHP
jgi:hypothetical protein